MTGTYFSRMSYKTAQKEILAEKKSELRKIRMNKQQAAGLADELETLSELNEKFDTRLINRKEKGLNLDYFYKLEAETGLTLQVDQLDQTDISGKTAGYPKLDNYDSVGFTIQLSGTPKQVITFLYQLRVRDRFCRITSFSTSAQEGSDVVAAKMTVELLAIKPEEKAKK